jgi:hypothetical protein
MTLSSRLLRGAALKLFREWILQDTWREDIVAKEQVKFETTHSSEASSGYSHHLLLCKLHSTWPKEWRYICGNLAVRWNHEEVNMEAVKAARINDWKWLKRGCVKTYGNYHIFGGINIHQAAIWECLGSNGVNSYPNQLIKTCANMCKYSPVGVHSGSFWGVKHLWLRFQCRHERQP